MYKLLAKLMPSLFKLGAVALPRTFGKLALKIGMNQARIAAPMGAAAVMRTASGTAKKALGVFLHKMNIGAIYLGKAAGSISSRIGVRAMNRQIARIGLTAGGSMGQRATAALTAQKGDRLRRVGRFLLGTTLFTLAAEGVERLLGDETNIGLTTAHIRDTAMRIAKAGTAGLTSTFDNLEEIVDTSADAEAIANMMTEILTVITAHKLADGMLDSIFLYLADDRNATKELDGQFSKEFRKSKIMNSFYNMLQLADSGVSTINSSTEETAFWTRKISFSDFTHFLSNSESQIFLSQPIDLRYELFIEGLTCINDSMLLEMLREEVDDAHVSMNTLLYYFSQHLKSGNADFGLERSNLPLQVINEGILISLMVIGTCSRSLVGEHSEHEVPWDSSTKFVMTEMSNFASKSGVFVGGLSGLMQDANLLTAVSESPGQESGFWDNAKDKVLAISDDWNESLNSLELDDRKAEMKANWEEGKADAKEFIGALFGDGDKKAQKSSIEQSSEAMAEFTRGAR